MGLKDLPLAGGERHVAAFVHAGWACVRRKGSHQILEREGFENHLTVPCHPGKDVKRPLLAGLIKDAGMDYAAYCDHFYRRVPRVEP